MSDILVSGINRNGSTETATPNSASLIVNYRQDNGRWGEVGDKIFVGCVEQICNKYVWHYKLDVHTDGFTRDGENYVIGFYEDGDVGVRKGRLAIFDITAQYDVLGGMVDTTPYRTFLLDEDGTTPYEIELAYRANLSDPWEVRDVFCDLYTFNDLLVLETKKQSVYFYYDERKQNYVKLPPLADLKIFVTDNGYNERLFDSTPVNVASIEVGAESFENNNAYKAVLYPKQTAYNDPLMQGLSSGDDFNTHYKVRNISHPAFRCFDDIKQAAITSLNMKLTKRKDKMKESNDVIKAFRVIAVTTLADGSVLNVSNVYEYIDYDRHANTQDMYNSQKGTVVDYGQVTIQADCGKLRGNSESQKEKYFNGFGSFRVESDIYPAYNPEKPNDYYTFNNMVGKQTYRLYHDVFVDIVSDINNYYKWVELNIIKEISIYCTDIIDFLDYNDLKIVSPARMRWTQMGNLTADLFLGMDEIMLNFLVPLKDMEDAMSVPFYKIGAITFKNNEAKMQIKGKMFAGIANKPSLSIDQIMGKRYVSDNNYTYNGIIHKCAVDTSIANYTYGAYEDKGVYLDINSKKYGWIRMPFWGSITGDSAGHYTMVVRNTAEVQNIDDVEKINLVIKHPTNPSVYKIFAENLQYIVDDTRNVGIILNVTKKSGYENSDNYTYKDYNDFPYWVSNVREFEYLTYSILTHIPNKTYTREYTDIHDTEIVLNIQNKTSSLVTVSYTVRNVNDYNEMGLDSNGNVMQLSATENPFVFPSSRNYVFGEKDNKIIECATTAQTLSDAKYGQLPLYVFCTQGVWVMETGENEVAYSTSHRISTIKCYNAPKMIIGTPYGVVFMSEEGLILIDTDNRFTNISIPLEGFLDMKCSSDIDTLLGSHTSDAEEYYDKFIEYVTPDTFCAYDQRYHELLVINKNKKFCYVFSLTASCWYIRSDGHELVNDDGTQGQKITQYQRCVDINGELHLVSQGEYYDPEHGGSAQERFDTFSKISEHEYTKEEIGNVSSEHIICTTPIFQDKYFKVEHLISRFYNEASQYNRYKIGMFIAGSRNGVEWKIVGKGILTSELNMNNAEIRRMICSCRYVQLSFVKIPLSLTALNSRFKNYFSLFSFDTSLNDAENKIR